MIVVDANGEIDAPVELPVKEHKIWLAIVSLMLLLYGSISWATAGIRLEARRERQAKWGDK